MFLPCKENTAPWPYTTHKLVMQPTGSPGKTTCSVSFLLPLPTYFFLMRGEYQPAVLSKVQCGQSHFADINLPQQWNAIFSPLALNCCTAVANIRGLCSSLEMAASHGWKMQCPCLCTVQNSQLWTEFGI